MQSPNLVLLALGRSDDTPFWIKALFAFALIGAAVWMHSSNHKKTSSAPPPLPGTPDDTSPPTVAARPDAPKPQEQTFIQKAFAFPGIGGWLSALVGLVIPFILFSIVLQPMTRNSPYGMTYLFAALSVWNLLFTAVARVRITLLFIPAWIVCLIGLAYSIYDAGTNPSP